MPLTSAAIKAMRQSAAKRDARRPFKTRMKSVLRDLTELAKAGKKEEAIKLLPVIYKVVDTAAKKHIVHWKNAAHKKSHAASLVAALGKKK
ncbi:MAG: 30S ribosomal protein S20 [Candidatus Peribacteraceae bacterium]|nr:30S ribosomal protein S20 [Candidatus Peribacteraceae bacterium]MDD5739737.1 30S ribosomal protein S20 [Candidatus Peribacteraceae bacterium]